MYNWYSAKNEVCIVVLYYIQGILLQLLLNVVCFLTSV